LIADQIVRRLAGDKDDWLDRTQIKVALLHQLAQRTEFRRGEAGRRGADAAHGNRVCRLVGHDHIRVLARLAVGKELIHHDLVTSPLMRLTDTIHVRIGWIVDHLQRIEPVDQHGNIVFEASNPPACVFEFSQLRIAVRRVTLNEFDRADEIDHLNTFADV
jgi:hypothetical protein